MRLYDNWVLEDEATRDTKATCEPMAFFASERRILCSLRSDIYAVEWPEPKAVDSTEKEGLKVVSTLWHLQPGPGGFNDFYPFAGSTFLLDWGGRIYLMR